jgi:hypothetical protein
MSSREVHLTDAELKEIFRKIAAGERRHGGFLTDFATAFDRADDDNFKLLFGAALALVGKYDLWEYRHDEDAITEFPPSR